MKIKHRLILISSLLSLIPIGTTYAFNSNILNKNHETITLNDINVDNASNENIDNVGGDVNINDNIQNEFSVWENTIKESSQNTNVKVFFTRNATIAFQQALIATNYMLLDKEKRENSDEIVWFVDYDLYDTKKYNFDYYNTTYGLTADGTSSKYNFSLWSRIGTDFSNNSDNANSNYQVIPSDEQIGKFLDHYTKKYGNDVSFDLWVPDVSIVSIWQNGKKPLFASNFYEFFKHINKINIISDGNWQAYNLATDMVKRLNKNNYVQLSDEKIKEQFNYFKKDKDNSYYSLFRQYSLYDYLHYSDMFTIFHTRSYTDSPYYVYPSDKKLYKAYSIDYDYISMSKKMFSSDEVKQKEFILSFETFFNIQNNTSIADFVWKNIEKYDPNKKNIIWMGDSLIRPDANGNEIYRFPEKQAEINKIVESYINKFPVSEYNYFVKHHPSFNHEYQESLNKYLFADMIDPICMNPFPWEVFLSWDHKMQEQKINEKSQSEYKPFFSVTSNNDAEPLTKLIGIQYTTTTIQTTAFYLMNTYNMSLDNIYKSIGINDWPIPMTFDIIERTTNCSKNPYKQFDINYEKIDAIYAPFYQLNIFPDYEKTKTSTLDYAEDLGLKFDLINQIIAKTNIDNTLVIVLSSISSILVITLISLLTVFLVKKYNKNKKK